MIKIENLKCTADWESVIRGMRNPMNSWDKSDSLFLPLTDPSIGENDIKLMERLAEAGKDHGKYLRMVPVMMDITAPLYWWAEFDTYKVGTVRNSCSFMHKGVSEPFSINDFSIHDERVYEILNELERKSYPLHYPYETNEYKLYTCGNMEYEIYKNGKIFLRDYTIVDSSGRTRHFKGRELISNSTEYHEARLGGRNNKERWLWHRLIATVWIENPNNYDTVDHINGDKGDNSVENLQWLSRSENIKKCFNEGSYNNISSLHSKYLRWKNNTKNLGLDTICNIDNEYNENIDLFKLTYTWESIINNLNLLREEYLLTKDDNIFQQIRCLLPSGYNQKATIFLNYTVLNAMYHARKNHKLDEWREFCEEIQKLPFSGLFTGNKEYLRYNNDK